MEIKYNGILLYFQFEEAFRNKGNKLYSNRNLMSTTLHQIFFEYINQFLLTWIFISEMKKAWNFQNNFSLDALHENIWHICFEKVYLISIQAGISYYQLHLRL